jgi:single-strand DNA-binding protein
MVSLNKVMIIGNVGSEPEIRFTPNGNPVTSFRVATNQVYTTADGERKQEKGRRVYTEGRLRSRTWEGQDGQRYYRTEMVVNRVFFLDRRTVATLPEERVKEAGTESG